MPIIKKNITKTLVISVLTGVFVFLISKFFLIDLARVNSLSMSDTLQQNTWVLIRPRTFLSSEIKRNDIVQLSLPLDIADTVLQKGLLFKRIIAIAGDTLLIQNSQVLINGQVAAINKNLLHNYIIKVNQQKDTSLFTDLGINEKYLIDDSCAYIITLTNPQYIELKKKNISIKENGEDSNLYDENIFPNNPKIKWNKDFFGPLYIPKKNDTLYLDTTNIILYEKVISIFENNSLEVKDGKIIINQKEAHYYITQQNYYFTIGDNFDNSIDSRYWGLIPEKAIRSKLIR
jgi:signal peptidase I